MKTKTSKAYQAARDSEFNKLSAEDQAAVLAAPDGAVSARLAARAIELEPTFWKSYYADPVLNRLANTVWHGMVFGEQTMLAMKAETCDEAQFIKAVQEAL